MIRLRGDRGSLLAALLAHWSEQQLTLPAPSRARPTLQLALDGNLGAGGSGRHRVGEQPMPGEGQLSTMGRGTSVGRTP